MIKLSCLFFGREHKYKYVLQTIPNVQQVWALRGFKTSTVMSRFCALGPSPLKVALKRETAAMESYVHAPK